MPAGLSGSNDEVGGDRTGRAGLPGKVQRNTQQSFPYAGTAGTEHGASLITNGNKRCREHRVEGCEKLWLYADMRMLRACRRMNPALCRRPCRDMFSSPRGIGIGSILG